ncbi:hypothetical protein [Streptomyces sp. NPDC010273]|uniref:hypothetical protein n=1 Tax=Streptomyces sp. NPDC010273 TaxID=3364829 RepID=UPI0036E6ED88
MSEHDVLTALRDSLDDITMSTPVEKIEAEGRRRRNRRRIVGTAGIAAAAALAVTVPMFSNPRSTAPPTAGNSIRGVHVQTAAYTVDTKTDGTIVATWDKGAYFSDHAGLEKALAAAGFPVLVKVGEFCKGSNDDGTLDPAGQGPGVDKVMRGSDGSNGRVNFTFYPSAMPAGKQLFIGYLNAAQLASVNNNPGSVERIISKNVPLTCTTTPPPAHRR